jgi:hypothetical protein
VRAADPAWADFWLVLLSVRLVLFRIEGSLGNNLEWTSLMKMRSLDPSSVTICSRVILFLVIVNGCARETSLQIKLIAKCQSGEVKRLGHWGLCPYHSYYQNHIRMPRIVGISATWFHQKD